MANEPVDVTDADVEAARETLATSRPKRDREPSAPKGKGRAAPKG